MLLNKFNDLNPSMYYLSVQFWAEKLGRLETETVNTLLFYISHSHQINFSLTVLCHHMRICHLELHCQRQAGAATVNGVLGEVRKGFL